jgi:hypothetical protein
MLSKSKVAWALARSVDFSRRLCLGPLQGSHFHFGDSLLWYEVKNA